MSRPPSWGIAEADPPEQLPQVTQVVWAPAFRIVPTRYPSVYIFDRVADPADFDALYALEAMTNDRLRDETGVLSLVPREQRIFGPGSGPIMAAFTHLNLAGSRFSDGSYGAFYAAGDRDTAIAETRHHHAAFLAATNEAPMHLPMRLYHVDIDAALHDLRPEGAVNAAVHAADSYSESQELARQLRKLNSQGVVFRSVRRTGGENVALFRPGGARDCRHAAHLLYAWDGAGFTDIYEKTA